MHLLYVMQLESNCNITYLPKKSMINALYVYLIGPIHRQSLKLSLVEKFIKVVSSCFYGNAGH